MANASSELHRLVHDALALDWTDLDFGVEARVNRRRRELAPRVQQQLAELLADARPRRVHVVVRTLDRFFFRHFRAGLLRADATHATMSDAARVGSEGAANGHNSGSSRLHFDHQQQFCIPRCDRPNAYAFRLPSGGRVVFELAESEAHRRAVSNGRHVEPTSDTRAPLRIVLADGRPQKSNAREVRLRFIERAVAGRASQAQLNRRTCAVILAMPELAQWRDELSAQRPGAKRRGVSRLEYHLGAFTTHPPSPVFIHRDLGEHLRRELDGFVQSELLDLEAMTAGDVEDGVPSVPDPPRAPLSHQGRGGADDPALYNNRTGVANAPALPGTLLQQPRPPTLPQPHPCTGGESHPQDRARLIRRAETVRLARCCGRVLIAALEEVEDIRKRCWLRRPLVLESHWCVTLDRVPEELYPCIAANAAQIDDWRRLLALDGCVCPPRSVDFFKSHPSLVVDTRHFDRGFTDRLLSSFDDLEGATDGLAIHADGFRAARLIEPHYAGRIKCAYVDPPYNTGSAALSYPDRLDHSAWLALLADRLEVARRLLRDDGALFVSIDDHEQARLRLLLERLFGEENLVATIVWEKVHTRKNSARHFSVSHEYILAAARNKDAWRRRLLPRDDTSAYANPDADPRGPWKADPVYANKPYASDYQIEKPNGERLDPPPGQFWRFSSHSFAAKAAAGEVLWGEGRSYPLVKRYLADVQPGLVPVTLFTRSFAGDNAQANAELNDLFGPGRAVAYPKPTRLVQRLLQIATDPAARDVALDFFAGSGTTGHAVMMQNHRDGGRRKYVLAEMGPHFEAVLRPRLIKAMYSRQWRGGRPQAGQRTGHTFNSLRLEAYDDPVEWDELDFRNPLCRDPSANNNDAATARRVDLVASFNFLLGLRVLKREANAGLCLVYGEDTGGRRVLVCWRNVDECDDHALRRRLPALLRSNRPPEIVYVNGCDAGAGNEPARLARRIGAAEARRIESEFARLRECID